jgi:hypothetical protein
MSHGPNKTVAAFRAGRAWEMVAQTPPTSDRIQAATDESAMREKYPRESGYMVRRRSFKSGPRGPLTVVRYYVIAYKRPSAS